MLRRFVMLALGLVGLLAVDRWLKAVALAGRAVEWPVGRFGLVENYGAVFSWPVRNSAVIVIMVIAIAGLAWYAVRLWRRGNFYRFVGAILMFVGAGSNLYDRLVHGFVIDWAYLGPWWPVFNLADVMIGVGVVVLLLNNKKTVQLGRV